MGIRVVDTRTRDIFKWCEWVVVDRLPLSFVDRRLVRKNAAMTPICEKTLVQYLRGVYAAVQERVVLELPSRFGIVLDGWTSHSRHYVALFAVFADEQHERQQDDTVCAA